MIYVLRFMCCRLFFSGAVKDSIFQGFEAFKSYSVL